MVDRKYVAAGLLEALEQSDRELRCRMRVEFRRVDRIKRQRGWTPFATAADTGRNVISGDGLAAAECGWCGDDFISMYVNRRWIECCCPSCGQKLSAFRRKRRRP